MNDLTFVTFLGVGHSLINLILTMYIATPSSDMMCHTSFSQTTLDIPMVKHEGACIFSLTILLFTSTIPLTIEFSSRKGV